MNDDDDRAELRRQARNMGLAMLAAALLSAALLMWAPR